MKQAEARVEAAAVYQQIKSLVVNYAFRPGEHLQVVQLADRLKVSTTPVRETLVRLCAEGLISSQPNKGFFSKPLDCRELSDLHELTFLLMKFAVERGTSLFTLSGMHLPFEFECGRIRCTDEDNANTYAAFQEQLYQRIVSLSRNSAMMMSVHYFNDRTHFLRVLDLSLPGRAQEVSEEGMDLVYKLQQGDVAAAIVKLDREMRRHIESLPFLVKEAVGRSLGNTQFNSKEGDIVPTAGASRITH